MLNRTRALMLWGGLATTAASLACDHGSGHGPIAPSNVQPARPVVTGIQPREGAATLPTVVVIRGSNFQRDATVTLGGVPATVSESTLNFITATTGVHEPGSVEVRVTNGDGEQGTLADAFTYVAVPTGPPPVIVEVAPPRGIVAGGTYVTIAGTGFHIGSRVSLGGVPVTANNHDGILYFKTPAHAAGPVDVVVTNPDGEGRRVGGYTFAHPEQLNFNGTWAGKAGDHWDFDFSFTIEHDALTSVSCAGGPPRAISPPLSVRQGEFSTSIPGLKFSGGFTSDGYGAGDVTTEVCTIHWEAWKR